MFTHSPFVVNLNVSSQNTVLQHCSGQILFHRTSFSKIILNMCNTVRFIFHSLYSILKYTDILVDFFFFNLDTLKFTLCEIRIPGLGQLYQIMYPTLQYHTELIHHSKISSICLFCYQTTLHSSNLW